MSEAYKVKQDLHLAYLSSPAWKAFRQGVLEVKGCKCEKCGEYGTDVHHKTYKNWGSERIEDVQVLCRPCHEAHHRVHRASGARKKAQPRLSAAAILSYHSQSQLENAAKRLGISLAQMRREMLCQNRSTCIKVAKALGVHVILPRWKLGAKERNKLKAQSLK